MYDRISCDPELRQGVYCPQGILAHLASVLLVVGLLALVWFGRTAKAEPPTPEEYKLILEELYARQAEAYATIARSNTLERALELDKQIRAAADEESDQIEQRIKKLQLQTAQKQWALSQFEVGERQLIPALEGVPKRMERWQHVRDVFKNKFLNFPEKSKGAVRSGRALNFFLSTCGPTALDHQIYREQLGTSKELLGVRGEESTSEVRMKESQNLQALGKDPNAIDVRLALLDEIRGNKIFSRRLLQNVIVQKGITGEKLKIRLNDEPLPLDWPSEVKANPDCTPYCRLLENAKSDAIESLRDGDSIPIDTQRQMMVNADELCHLFEGEYRAYIADLRASARGGSDSAWRAADMMVARRFLKELRGGITRFLAARDLHDVQLNEFPPKGQGEGEEDRVSVDELLAFMCRHGLHFAPADKNAETTYETLYQQMCKYYVDLYGLQLAIQSEEKKIELDEKRVEELFQRQFSEIPDLMSSGTTFGIGWSQHGGLRADVRFGPK